MTFEIRPMSSDAGTHLNLLMSRAERFVSKRRDSNAVGRVNGRRIE